MFEKVYSVGLLATAKCSDVEGVYSFISYLTCHYVGNIWLTVILTEAIEPKATDKRLFNVHTFQTSSKCTSGKVPARRLLKRFCTNTIIISYAVMMILIKIWFSQKKKIKHYISAQYRAWSKLYWSYFRKSFT